jgi:GNAT superfamily N-acetyltransferase
MLDKTIPYAGFYMVRKAGTPIPDFPLPEGFTFAMYQDGEEEQWAKLETAVLEFGSEFEALMYFKETFEPDKPELYKRLLFIKDSNGKVAATANAWWSFIDNNRRAWVHWVSTSPDYQGLGLGKAISAKVTKLMTEIEGDVDVFLHTQTWSYKAVSIYEKCGYVMTDEKILYKRPGKKDSYKKAVRILKELQKKNSKN